VLARRSESWRRPDPKSKDEFGLLKGPNVCIYKKRLNCKKYDLANCSFKTPGSKPEMTKWPAEGFRKPEQEKEAKEQTRLDNLSEEHRTITNAE